MDAIDWHGISRAYMTVIETSRQTVDMHYGVDWIRWQRLERDSEYLRAHRIDPITLWYQWYHVEWDSYRAAWDALSDAVIGGRA